MKMKSRLALTSLPLKTLVVAFAISTAAGCASPSPSGGTTGSAGHGGGNTTGAGGTATTNTTGAGGTTVNTTSGAGGTTPNNTGAAGTTTTTSGAAGTTTSTTSGAGGTTTSTTGAGGATTTTGAGGAGGAPVQKLCVTKTKIVSPVFMDFENYNGTVAAGSYTIAFGGTAVNTGTAYAGIYPYPESTGSTVPTLAIMAGHPPSTWAGSETLAANQWGMGGGVWMDCADASSYTGISFWVRGSSGTGTFAFSVSMPSTQVPDPNNPAGGGICAGTSDTCKDPVKSGIPITADWTQVKILWSDFTPGVSGTASVVPNGDNIAGMGWTVPLQFQADPTKPDAGVYVGVPATMVINIDDITFTQ